MRKLSAIAACGLLASALTVATPANADGPECNITSHCYGIAEYQEPAFNAVGQELWTDCLVLDPFDPGDFTTHEMWAIFPGNKFIETGYIKGGPIAGGNGETHFRYFWAEWTGTSFYSHYIASAPILNYVNFSLYRGNMGYWNIYVGGTLQGTTSYPYLYANVVQTGGETTEPKHLSHGKSRYLQMRNASTNVWSGATLDFSSATANVYHVNTLAERMEQYSLQKICNPLPGGPVGTFGARVLTDADFKASALEFAKVNGDAKPTSVKAVTSKRSTVNRTLMNSAKVDSDENVTVVQMKGNFTAHTASRPKGFKAPTGDTMTLVYNSVTGEVTDWSLSTNGQSINKL